jgi:XRE family aerobic/anaerobic benzoate catabolism transcriptional regulator
MAARGGREADRLLSELGGRLRQRRHAAGLTLKALAERSGLSLRLLVQLEAARGNPSLRSLVALAGALGLPPAGLLSAPASPEKPVVALLGLRGAGKTTLGRRLARRWRRPFVELDRRIEAAAGMTLAEIFAFHGEGYYRRLEREVLLRLLDEGRTLVLATGGSLVTSPETWALLRARARTVWLKAGAEDHWNRVLQQGDRRPMADKPQAMAELVQLLRAREPLYAEADLTVDTSALGREGAARAIHRALGPGARRARTRRLAGG